MTRWVSSAITAACVTAMTALVSAQTPQGSDDTTNVTNEYRITVFPHYPITKSLSGFGYLGWVQDGEAGYRLYYVGMPGFIYTVKPWLQAWTALLGIYTDNDRTVNAREDSLELRPFV